jgi:capsular polysaccharide transport system permease protein
MPELSRQTPASAVSINLAVIRAILLRDIRILTGTYCFGILMLLLMPLGHLLAVVLIYHVLGRMAPQGTDQTVYYGLSILPFVIYIYMARQIIISVMLNRPLLYFTRVKIFDILIARCILEIANAIFVFIIIVLILSFYSNGFSPRDWTGIVFAVAATIYLAFCMGMINALISHVVPVWPLLFNLSAPILWAASGIVFFPADIPDPYNHWLAWNPLLQCVEWLRFSYYENYPDTVMNIPYLLGVSTALLALSLVAEKLSRRVFR